MAIYHCSAKIISRSGGRSATASAAYRAAEKIKDERQNMTFNYRSREQSVDHAEIISPDGSPSFVKDRSNLWNAVESCEKRKDSQVAREVEIALPRELTLEQNIELAKEFVKGSFVDRGMVADLCIHDANGENPHAHIMLTTRHLTSEGFGKKNRDWNKDELLQRWREEWEHVCNKHLELHNHQDRIDHRTLEDQGIDRAPQKHLGVTATSYERRTGFESDKRIKAQMRQLSSSILAEAQEKMRLKEMMRAEAEQKLQQQMISEKKLAKEKERPSRGFSR